MRYDAFRQFGMIRRDFEGFVAFDASGIIRRVLARFDTIRIEVFFGLKEASLEHSRVNSHVRRPFGTRFV